MKIYQIYYNELSKSKIDSRFIPFDNTIPNKPNEFEYGVMRHIYQNLDPFNKNKYLGVLSWKFKDKTKINASKLNEWLKKNKGYDVYTINPFSHMNKYFSNVWSQGNHFHNGMLELVKYLFDITDLDLSLEENYSPKVVCYCNYWIANEKFWNIYMYYTEKLYNTLYECDQEIIDKLFNIQADNIIQSGMFSFIFERMFSSVLHKYQKEFKVLPYFV